MNSREKGKRGERMWRDELRAQGFEARRGQQFCGSPDSPDVVSPALPWAHFEVKAVQRLNIYDAMLQAICDCGPAGAAGTKVPIVAHRRNRGRWLVTMTSEDFFRFLRADLPPVPTAPPSPGPTTISAPHHAALGTDSGQQQNEERTTA